MTIELALLLFAFIPAAAFCLLFGTRVAWWRNSGGQHLFAFTLAMAILFGASIWAELGGPLSAWFVFLVIFAIGVLLWQRLWLLVKAQWLQRNGDHKR